MPQSAPHYDVIVIGLGAMGGAAAMELARRGQRVLGLDAHAIPNTMGAHHGGPRVIRLAYAEHPDYVPLLRESFRRWEAFEDVAGETLVHLVGGLYMGPPDGPFVTGVQAATRAHGLPHEILDTARLRTRFPQFAVPDGTIGVLERQAGAVMAEATVAAQARVAMTAGAELHGHEPVRAWHAAAPGGSGENADDRSIGRPASTSPSAAGDATPAATSDPITVVTDHATYTADRLVIAAGAWSHRVLVELHLPLVVTRQLAGWFQPRRPARFRPETCPVWGLEHADGGFEYGFPVLPGRPGVKYAHHLRGTPVDPETLDRTPTAADREHLHAAIARHLPDAAGAALSVTVCMYTNTPDGHFVVGSHPADPRVVFAAGFSGHGFKFAPVIGAALADLAIDGRTDLPIDFLSPARFDDRG